MSYRGIKRLLGETSLERKCRLLLGGGIFLLVLVSFFFYGYQTEKLVWEETKRTAELLVSPVLLRSHFTSERGLEVQLPKNVEEYQSRYLRPNVAAADYKPTTLWEVEALNRLVQRPETEEIYQFHDHGKVFQYLSAVRMADSCLKCHPTARDRQLGITKLQTNDLLAAVSLELRLAETELRVNLNRAILLSFAIGSAILAMGFAYIIVRYVIVKPVKHLKEVSEEVASGNLTVRANIQTGDEFEELSQVFNRMLRSLVSMQDELRKVNTDLDLKLDELAQANMALFEMNKLKSDFLATISHELRTPLNSILGFGDLLAETSTLDGKQKRWVQNIQTSGKMLLRLITDVLDLAKLEAGKMQVNIEEFSLRDVVEGQIQMTRPLADRKNIEITGEVDPAIPILRQDSSKLQQILSNLLSNAIKFTPEGGRIQVICRADRAHVVISVVDNGVGIAPEDQRLVFEKFRQAEGSLTREHGGTGLGLSIVRELTKLLGGGEVHLESELGRGSSFTVRIPMQFTEPTPTLDLGLAEAGLDIDRQRQAEVRYYSSRERIVGADI